MVSVNWTDYARRMRPARDDRTSAFAPASEVAMGTHGKPTPDPSQGKPPPGNSDGQVPPTPPPTGTRRK
ncbi:hypothetical protein GCM10010298_11850 [Streptomyces microflavus]|uniref:Uncharacterized protein n=2 Tax=Streptomyces microflavus TaxID=1919 RepID=A0A7J0CTE3_STRMI|nr:hypothetical protein Smic_35830 [Streptomyces microflavus]GGX50036.1 hypothetical protein GCM10010298_11850 [Streptomyces microflavus]